jgi:hypothetical protein
MLNIFIHIKDNSTWILDGETVVVFKTSWVWDNIIIYPMVYYYQLQYPEKLYCIPRFEFLSYAQKYNIIENEDNRSKI